MKSRLMLAFAVTFIGIAAVAQTADPNTDFLNDVLKFIASFGGLSSMLKISGILMLIVASMKVTFLAPIWNKLPAVLQTFMAPLLGLAAGLLGLGMSGAPVTWASALAFMGAGTGSVFLHEILDGIKALPGIGTVYISIINVIENIPWLGASSGSGSNPTPPAA